HPGGGSPDGSWPWTSGRPAAAAAGRSPGETRGARLRRRGLLSCCEPVLRRRPARRDRTDSAAGHPISRRSGNVGMRGAPRVVGRALPRRVGLRPPADGVLDLLATFGRTPLAEQQDPEVLARVEVVGVLLERAPEGFFRARRVALAPPEQCERVR